MPSAMKPKSDSAKKLFPPGFPGKQTITDKVGYCEEHQYHYMREGGKGECPSCPNFLSRLKLENDALRKKLKAEEGHQCVLLGKCSGGCRS